MKINLQIIVIAILLLLSINGCSLSDPRLLGTWQSNLELTTQYNKEHTRIDDLQLEKLSQIFGMMEVTYKSDNSCEFYFPKHTLKTKEKVFENEESLSVEDYKIIFQRDNILVLEHSNNSSEKNISVINFVNENTYWIYLGYSEVFDLHLREYFTKK